MADAGRQNRERAEAIESIATARANVRQILATGTLPVGQEIMIRAKMADLLIRTYDRQEQQDFLNDAVQHLETILRRLARDSADRPTYMNKLSFAKMSEHEVTNSRHALDESISYARQAKELGLAGDLVHSDAATYFDILTNLGYSLSHRYALTRDYKDLDESIACAKETYDKASKDSEPYYLTLNNFASRLRMRYLVSQNQDDINEAMRLIGELMSRFSPGTAQYGVAVGQLGMMSSDKFNKTGKLQDLDEALRHCKTGLEALHGEHETRVPMLRQVLHLYTARHRITAESLDLKNLAHYSGLLFQSLSPRHSARGQYLLDHLGNIKTFAIASRSLQDVQGMIKGVQPLLDGMPAKYAEKQQCEGIFVDLLGRQYSLSHKLQDLVTCAVSANKMLMDYNDQVDKAGSSKALVSTSWLWGFMDSLRQLAQAPEDNHMRTVAEDEIKEAFKSCYDPKATTLRVLEQISQQKDLRLQVLEKAISSRQTLSKAEIDAEEGRLKDQKISKDRRPQGRSSFKRTEYQTEVGLRELAIDESGNIILDLSNIMEDALGFDPKKTYSETEYAALVQKEEQKALDKARSEGRHPNLRLCRMCRDLAKVLQPTEDGFQLTAKDSYLPFGNCFQLKCRQDCSICGLIFSTITTRAGALHPRLQAIDREVQGTRLSTGKLSTGETLMRFDYGIRHVGELRVLTPRNYSQALRQGWELDSPSLADAFGSPGSIIHDPGRQQINFDMVQSWLKNCDHNHGTACNHPRSKTRVKKLPMTFIDVIQQCLVPASSDVKYFALSYVWGQVDMSKTLKSNYHMRRLPLSLAAAPFPRTIKDAMALVRSLGERFLWVDAICMVQDDKEQMARDIPNMDIVYGQAFATIVALEGRDADAGLPGVAPGTRPPQEIRTITISDRSPNLDDDPNSDSTEEIHIVATPRPLHLALDLSQWNTRGWIVQEHLLSRRCLYFAPDAVYFQCSQETLSEGGANETFDAFMFDTSPMSDNSILQKANRDNPLFDLDRMYDLPPGERPPKAFNAYKKLVETYSRRNLSFKSDILNAFAGMFEVLEQHFQSTTVYGLPAAVLSHGLLWTPAARLPRRGTQLPDLAALRDGNMGAPDAQFPSWSWVGWDGPVEYRLYEQVKEEVLLPIPKVRVYETSNGPISEAVEAGPRAQIPPEKASDDSEVQETSTGFSPEKKDAEDKQVVAKIVPDPLRGSQWFVMPPQAVQERNDPHMAAKMLRFTARSVPVPAFRILPGKEYLSLQSQIHIQGPQAVRRIHDRNGKHCGLWWEQAGYGYVGLGMSPEAESKIDMVEISAYGDAYQPRRGPYRVEGGIRMFDEREFPGVGAGSGLVNVLVVDWDVGLPDGVGERCTVAVIHSRAWEDALPKEKEVRLV
ncbi:hypothetical protein ACJZ2D_012825 [Fusarium nematophilum]